MSTSTGEPVITHRVHVDMEKFSPKYQNNGGHEMNNRCANHVDFVRPLQAEGAHSLVNL